MFNNEEETALPPNPDEHHVEVAPHHRWSALKIFSSLAIVVLVFGAGLAVGRGDIHIWKTQGAVNSAPNSLDYASVDSVYSILKNDYDGQLNAAKLNDGLKKGLVDAAGDPYTEYFNANEAKDFNNQLSGTITGIGAELGTDADKNIVIVAPLSGYPAEKAGLKPKDIVAAVDKDSTQGMSVDAVVKKIRGKEGTDVTLTIVRGNEKAFQVTIKREKITVPSVKYQVDNGIGYIKISQFSTDTVDLAQKAATEFKAQNVKGIVVDLRSDPGGYLSGAVGVSSLWLDKGKVVVQEKRGGKVVSTEYANGNDPLKGIPTVVLIDGGSASASEITAGALHDNNAAQLIGVKSFGKGSVQQVENLPDGAEMKVTIARWFTPAGKNIDKQGITPDVVVEAGANDSAITGTDIQKDKAYEIIRSKIQ